MKYFRSLVNTRKENQIEMLIAISTFSFQFVFHTFSPVFVVMSTYGIFRTDVTHTHVCYS